MADPENQTTPLAPPGDRSDQQPFTTATRKHKEASKLLVYLLATFVLLFALFLILASIFLRVVNPSLRLHSVQIQTFQFNNNNNNSNSTNSTNSLNVTMLTELALNNENFGRYVFDDCNAVLLYGNDTIGGGGVSGGRVGARERKLINVSMRIGYVNSSLSEEVMEVRSYALMSGRVHVTNIMDRRRTIEMNCTISLNLTSRSFVDDPVCR